MDDGGKAGIFHTEYAVFPFFYGIFRLFYRMWRKTRPSFPQVLKSVCKTIHTGREAFPAEHRFQVKKTSPDESGDAEFSFLRNPVPCSERCDQMYIGLSSVYALEFLSGQMNG